MQQTRLSEAQTAEGKTVVVVWSRRGMHVMGSEAEVEMEEQRQGDVG